MPTAVFTRPRLSLAALLVAGILVSVGSDAPPARAETDPAADVGTSLSGRFLAGRLAQNQGDLGLAADLLLPVLQADPDNTALARRLFALLAADGRMEEALPLARRVVAADGPDPMVSLFVAADDVRAGRLEGAHDAVAALPDEGLGAYTKPIFLGWILQGLGKTDAAMAAFEPLGARDGARALYNMHAGLVSEAAGRFDAAETFYRASLDDQNGSSLRLVELLAAFYARRDRDDEAEAVVAAFLKKQGGSVGQVARERLARERWSGLQITTAAEGIAEGMFGLGNSVRGQAGGDTALYLGQMANLLRPGFDMVQIMLGEVMQADRRYGRAIEIYQDIEKGSAFYRSARLRIASAMEDAGRVDEAIATLDDLADVYPDDADPLIDLGDVYRGHEDFEKAVDAYDRAFRRLGAAGPDDWRLLYARGIALERTDAWARAEKDFLKALEYAPDQPFVLNYLGYSWIDQGLHLDRALDMIRKAVSLRPTDGYIVDSLGWGLYKTGAYAEAVREMERAVELRPQDPIINDHLGDSYWKVGRKREARFQWRRSLSLDPEDDLIETIRKKLDHGLPANNG